MWWPSSENVMVLCEVAAVAAILALAPLVYATLRRTLESHGTKRRSVYSAQVAGCDEPACPYYEKNLELLMVPARRTKID